MRNFSASQNCKICGQPHEQDTAQTHDCPSPAGLFSQLTLKTPRKNLLLLRFLHYRRFLLNKVIFVLVKIGLLKQAENLLFWIAQKQKPSLWSLTFYLHKIAFPGKARKLDALIDTKHIHPDHLPLLLSARARINGDLSLALSFLQYSSSLPKVRLKVAVAERSIYHQLRDYMGGALAGNRFLQANPDTIVLEFTLHTAGIAENAGREDLARMGFARLLSDIQKIKTTPNLFRRHWKQAAEVSASIFDLAGAIDICDMAIACNYKKAREKKDHFLALQKKLAPLTSLVNKAHEDIRHRAAGTTIEKGHKKACIILHSAIVHKNKIDYIGFRDDIRFVYQTISELLREHRIDFDVRAKIKTHGEINLDQTFFSYHTISSQQTGLHFKETDRPHSFCLDTQGYSGWSYFSKLPLSQLKLDTIDPHTAHTYFESDAARVISKGISKYKQPDTLDKNLPEKYIFIALQIVGDAVQSLAYASPIQMIEEVCAVGEASGLPVVVKRHPYCRSTQLADYVRKGAEDGRFHVAQGNVHDLISKSVAVCVVNSAVGAEALLHKKSVYVFGRSEYMGACYVCEHPGDFHRQFSPDTPRLHKEELEKFWYYLRHSFAIDLQNHTTARNTIRQKAIEHLARNGMTTLQD